MIVSLDTLYVGRALAKAVESWLFRRYAIAPRNVLLIASHTHFAPSLDADKPRLGAVDQGYLSETVDRVCGLLDHLLTSEKSIEVMIGIGQESAPHNVNRRRPWPFPHRIGPRGVGFGPVTASYRRGMRDPILTVARLVDTAGSHRAVIVHYACHPVSYPRPLEVSADYIGIIRDALRKEYGPTTAVIFLQGFAGDLRPLPPDARDRAPLTLSRRLYRLVRVVDQGPSDPPHTVDSWRKWAQLLASDAISAAHQGSLDPLTGSLRAAHTRVGLSEIVKNATEGRFVEFRRFVVGDALDIVAVGAEPVVELKAMIPFPGALAVGYAGDVFGYWPTDAQLREGGYEAVGFQHSFSVPGPLLPGLDAAFARAISKLISPQ
ncbi:MAG: hypothetical protein M3T56_09500 [Chloroflexota bacterium]|nr:hypothetical protein [Chloroflexota bacterium]